MEGRKPVAKETVEEWIELEDAVRHQDWARALEQAKLLGKQIDIIEGFVEVFGGRRGGTRAVKIREATVALLEALRKKKPEQGEAKAALQALHDSVFRHDDGGEG